MDGELSAQECAHLGQIYPELERMVTGMKRDARVLASLEVERAPAGLAERITAAMEQAGSRATVSVEWKDQSGHAVKVDGPTQWASSVPATVECVVATGNPQIANLYAPGPVGSAQIQATADADLGEGQKAVTATLDVTVIAGEAIGGDITFKPTPTR